MAANTAAWLAGKQLDWDGFEELTKLHGVTIPIQTLGSCRKNVTEVSQDGFYVRKKARPALFAVIERMKEAVKLIDIT